MTHHVVGEVSSLFLDRQILATVAYSDQFLFPLSLFQIQQRLVSGVVVGGEGEFNKKADQELVIRLEALVKMGVLIKGEGCFGLSTTYKSKELFLKMVRHKSEKKKLSHLVRRQAVSLLRLAVFSPWIRAVGITGAVAVSSAAENDDLDLLVITSAHTLWIVRSILLIFSVFMGKKHAFRTQKIMQPHTKVRSDDAWCFNTWLDETSMKIEPSRRNLFTAYESLQVDWILDKDRLEQSYDLQNAWINDHLFLWHRLLKNESFSEEGRAINKGFWFEIVNQLAFIIAKKHITKKTNIPEKNLLIDQAWLHDDVSYKQYLAGWEALYQLAWVATSAKLKN